MQYTKLILFTFFIILLAPIQSYPQGEYIDKGFHSFDFGLIGGYATHSKCLTSISGFSYSGKYDIGFIYSNYHPSSFPSFNEVWHKGTIYGQLHIFKEEIRETPLTVTLFGTYGKDNFNKEFSSYGFTISKNVYNSPKTKYVISLRSENHKVKYADFDLTLSTFRIYQTLIQRLSSNLLLKIHTEPFIGEVNSYLTVGISLSRLFKNSEYDKYKNWRDDAWKQIAKEKLEKEKLKKEEKQRKQEEKELRKQKEAEEKRDKKEKRQEEKKENKKTVKKKYYEKSDDD